MKKDAAARADIVAALERQLEKGDKSLVGNKGYRRILADPKGEGFAIDRAKVEEDQKFDGVFALQTNAHLSPLEAMLVYKNLSTVEEAFKNLKGDLAIRPIFHHDERRIEAHIFVAFLAYCLHVTIALRLKGLAPGLTLRSLFEKFSAVQMIDVHIPTADGRELQLTRYTQPETELMLLLDRLRLDLPEQPPPKITCAQANAIVPA